MILHHLLSSSYLLRGKLGLKFQHDTQILLVEPITTYNLNNLHTRPGHESKKGIF